MWLGVISLIFKRRLQGNRHALVRVFSLRSVMLRYPYACFLQIEGFRNPCLRIYVASQSWDLDRVPSGPTIGPGGLDWSRMRPYRRSMVRPNARPSNPSGLVQWTSPDNNMCYIGQKNRKNRVALKAVLASLALS